MRFTISLALAAAIYAQTPAAAPRPAAASENALEALVKLAEANANRPRSQRTAVLEVKQGDVARIHSLLSAPGVSIHSDHNLRVIAITADYNVLPTLVEAVKKMDVAPSPTPNIEITAHLIAASTRDLAAQGIPDELAQVVKQLAGVLPNRNYRLLDSFVLRGRDGQGGSSSGTVPGWPENSKYEFSYRSASVVGGNPRTIRLDRVNLRLAVVSKTGLLESGIVTDIDAKEGQKIVVGKSNADAETAMVLVLIARLVE